MTATGISRLQRQRRQSVEAALQPVQDLLTAPDVDEQHRVSNACQYMRCVLAQLAEIDDRIWAATSRQLAADGAP